MLEKLHARDSRLSLSSVLCPLIQERQGLGALFVQLLSNADGLKFEEDATFVVLAWACCDVVAVFVMIFAIPLFLLLFHLHPFTCSSAFVHKQPW